MKTIEQLQKEKRILEQEINGKINVFKENNPEIEFDVEYTVTSIKTRDGLASIVNSEVKIKLTL